MARGKNTATATAPLTTEAPQSTQSRTLSSAILVTVTAVCWERYLAIVTVVAQAIWEIAAPIKNVAVISNPTFRADSVEIETQDCDPRQDARGRAVPSRRLAQGTRNATTLSLRASKSTATWLGTRGASRRRLGAHRAGKATAARTTSNSGKKSFDRSLFIQRHVQGDGALAIVVAVVGHAARVASKVDRCYFSDAVVYSVAVRFLEPLGMVRHKVRKPSHWAAIHTDTVNITRSHLHTRVQSQEQIVTTEQSWEVPAHDHRAFDLAERGHKWNHRTLCGPVCRGDARLSSKELSKRRNLYEVILVQMSSNDSDAVDDDSSCEEGTPYNSPLKLVTTTVERDDRAEEVLPSSGAKRSLPAALLNEPAREKHREEEAPHGKASGTIAAIDISDGEASECTTVGKLAQEGLASADPDLVNAARGILLSLDASNGEFDTVGPLDGLLFDVESETDAQVTAPWGIACRHAILPFRQNKRIR
ncbi:hypothetical protein FI667_g12629, partial [Globisporangium splendens]